MPDDEQITLMIYNHCVQLTLLDMPVDQAVRLACDLAVLVLDPARLEAEKAEAMTRAGVPHTSGPTPT